MGKHNERTGPKQPHETTSFTSVGVRVTLGMKPSGQKECRDDRDIPLNGSITLMVSTQYIQTTGV